MDLTIRQAGNDGDIAAARSLLLQYGDSLGSAICFQSFEKELAELPGAYSPPAGALLLAYHGADAAGCVAYRPHAKGICEMKRLYVKPEFRHSGAGRLLIGHVLELARRNGYKAIRLDTLPTMDRAIALYRSLGFRAISTYYPNPSPGVLFFELDLLTPAARRAIVK
jgi:putative acetyltransferase